MSFGFLGKVAQTVGHDVSVVARGNSGPGGGVFGFLNHDVAQPLVNNVAKVANEAIALPQVITNPQGAQRTLSPGGGLGHQGGVLGGAELGNDSVFIGNKAVQNIKKTAGTGASIGGTIAAPSFGFLSAGTLGTRILKGALTGAPAGAIGSTGQQLEDTGKVNPGQVALGALAGAGLGAAAPIASTVVKGLVHQFATGNEIGAIGKQVDGVVPPKPSDVHIQTPLGVLRIGADEMNALVKAETPQDVRKVIGDSLPQNITDKLAVSIPKVKDPNIISNLISREVAPPSPPPERITAPVNQELAARQEVSPAARQVLDTLAEAQKTRDLQNASYSAERGARAGAAAGASKELVGSEAYYAKLAQLKGPLAKEEYQGLSGHLSPTEQEANYTHLGNEIESNPNLDFYGKLNTQTAIRKVIFGNQGVPTDKEIGMLQKQFGDNFANAIKEDAVAHNDRLTAYQTFGQQAGQVAGLPRELMATADFSGGLRQGLAAATRHPLVFARAFANQFEFFASENAYHDAEKAIYEHPDYPLLHQSGTAILELDKKLGPTEEKFISNLGEKIPIVGRLIRASNRAYTGLLNNMRANIFYDKIATLRNADYDFNSPDNFKLVKDLGTVINTSTGRGNLGRFEAAGHALSTALFAPRLIASRLSMLDPRYYINLEPAARREALTTLASIGAFGTGILSLAELLGGKVSKDPTNADFGKVRIGDTRLDPLGGYAQYIRLGAQLVEGKKTNSTTGATTELGKGIAASRWDVFTNFLANKEAPVPSFATTVLKGKDAAGNPINYSHEVLSRFTPLLAQDIKDLYTHENALGGSQIGRPLAAAAGAFGVGLQTYSAQDSPLSTKQTKYIQNLRDNGVSADEIKASTRFFQDLKEAAGTRANVNTAIDKALANNDLPKAQQLADQYNKELEAGIHAWNQKYGRYATQDLQDAYDKQKINLSGSSINTRLKAINSTKPF